MGDESGANEYSRSSLALASVGQFPDLMAYGRLTRGTYHRHFGKPEEAIPDYNAALSESRRLGIRRLEVEALSELSRVALALGDHDTARHRAMGALMIANRNGLGLRVTHSLLVLGLALIRGNQVELGVAHLNHAHDLGMKQEYWLRTQEAEYELRKAGRWKEREFLE
jgi:hypothetical protein